MPSILSVSLAPPRLSRRFVRLLALPWSSPAQRPDADRVGVLVHVSQFRYRSSPGWAISRLWRFLEVLAFRMALKKSKKSLNQSQCAVLFVNTKAPLDAFFMSYPTHCEVQMVRPRSYSVPHLRSSLPPLRSQQ